MINFTEEIKKYSPILEIGEIEESIHSTDLKDIMDMLGHIAKNNGSGDSGKSQYTERR